MSANTTTDPVSRLTPVEAEVIAFFVEISHALGQPPSYAQIYGCSLSRRSP